MLSAEHEFRKFVRDKVSSPNHYLMVKDITCLTVPDDSVAMELFYDYQVIYPKEESAQEIGKSIRCETKGYDNNAPFYEYAIVTKDYNTVLSVVWRIEDDA